MSLDRIDMRRRGRTLSVCNQDGVSAGRNVACASGPWSLPFETQSSSPGHYDPPMARAQSGGPGQDGVRNVMSGTAEVVVQAGHVHGDVVVSPGPEHLDIEVSCEPAEIEAMPNQLDLIYPWMDSERARLHALADGYDWSQNKRSLDFLDHQHEVRQGDIRDLRTREVYESYIEDYLAQAHRP